jgi:hydrogenase maturation factor
MKTGKLNIELLSKLIKKYSGYQSNRVVLGPKIGEDAAVIDFPEKYLVAKADPITFATDEIGWYAVNINANDIATRGAKPKWFLSTILLPQNSTEDLAEKIFSQIDNACKQLGISVIGGHTEVTYGIDRPIVSGFMLGEVEKDKLIKTSGAKVGDDVLLTKGIAIEGTAVIAREKESELRKKGYDNSFIEKCKNYLYSPGISVVKDALIASRYEIHSMHDPTEGGLLAGLWEIAKVSGKGMLVYKDKIKVLPESKKLCREFGLDVYRTLASGCLLLTVNPKDTGKLLADYKNNGIKAWKIGKIMDSCYGIKLENGEEIEYLEKDEITKIFEDEKLTTSTEK